VHLIRILFVVVEQSGPFDRAGVGVAGGAQGSVFPFEGAGTGLNGGDHFFSLAPNDEQVYGANISARESKTLLWVTGDKLPNFFTILLLSIVLI
jgi:hypothetical protein